MCGRSREQVHAVSTYIHRVHVLYTEQFRMRLSEKPHALLTT